MGQTIITAHDPAKPARNVAVAIVHAEPLDVDALRQFREAVEDLALASLDLDEVAMSADSEPGSPITIGYRHVTSVCPASGSFLCMPECELCGQINRPLIAPPKRPRPLGHVSRDSDEYHRGGDPQIFDGRY